MLAVDTSSPFVICAGSQLCVSAWKSAGGNDPPHAVLQTASAPGHADILVCYADRIQILRTGLEPVSEG